MSGPRYELAELPPRTAHGPRGGAWDKTRRACSRDVGITPHAVSYAEVAGETCAPGGQRVVVANGESWLGFTIESRSDSAPALTDFRLLDGPRDP